MGRGPRFYRATPPGNPGEVREGFGRGFWRRLPFSEKTYLLGKFARVALGTRHIDYNGRLCMVSAGTAYKLAFHVDRSPIQWEEITRAEAIFVIGAKLPI
jgi:anaerobic selenocysteine-containing dehydrogenase